MVNAGAIKGQTDDRALWLYGLRLTVLIPLTDPVPVCRVPYPATVNEREVLQALVPRQPCFDGWR